MIHNIIRSVSTSFQCW